jgi:hypothetical protein
MPPQPTPPLQLFLLFIFFPAPSGEHRCINPPEVIAFTDNRDAFAEPCRAPERAKQWFAITCSSSRGAPALRNAWPFPPGWK